MNDRFRDVFISHAGADKSQYITPLTQAFAQYGLSYWLDSEKILWGDRIVQKMNEGLAKSQFVLLCLSKNYLAKPWPESEMEAALSLQNAKGVKGVLPLILNSKEEVLKSYPLIAGLAYREFNSGPDAIALELQKLLNPEGDKDVIEVTVESVHDGSASTLMVPRRVSIRWLTQKLVEAAGVRNEADAGAFEELPIRWVLVDAEAETEWAQLPEATRERVRAIFKSDRDLKVCFKGDDRLDELGLQNKTVFHLHAVVDKKAPLIRYRSLMHPID